MMQEAFRQLPVGHGLEAPEVQCLELPPERLTSP